MSLSQEDKDYLVKLTGSSEQKVENHHKAFLIRYPSGKIEMPEFLKAAKSFFKKISRQDSDAESFCKFVFKAYDTNEDGSLSFREATKALWVGQKKAPKEEKIKNSFRLFDFNKNGDIDKKEMYDCIMGLMKAMGEDEAEMGKDMEEGVKEIMDEIDTNKDDKITEKEFTDGCNKDRGTFKFLSNLNDMIGQILQSEMMEIAINEELRAVFKTEFDMLASDLDDILKI